MKNRFRLLHGPHPHALPAAIMLAFLLAAGGCAALKPAPSAHPAAAPLSASLTQLLARLSPGPELPVAVKATYSAAYSDARNGKTRSVSGILAMERPSKLRMKGSAAMLPNLFDLLYDGTQLTIFVPRENTVYRASSPSAAMERGLPDAECLPRIYLGETEKRGTLHLLECLPSQYIVYSIEPRGAEAAMVRKVFFDRADLSPVRYQYFDAAGGLSRDVVCGRFAAPPGCAAALPGEVVIEAPAEGKRVALRMSEMTAAIPLPPALFTFTPPRSAVVRPVEELAQ